MSESIRLYNKRDNHKDFHSDEKDLKKMDTYVKAEVLSGKWILYHKADFNKSIGNGAYPENLTVLTNAKETVNISTLNGSLFHVPSDQNGLVLFEFNYYGGGNKKYDEEEAQLTEFPNGANSAMVGENNGWLVYEKEGINGTPSILTKGTDYPTPDEMKVSLVKSINPQS